MPGRCTEWLGRARDPPRSADQHRRHACPRFYQLRARNRRVNGGAPYCPNLAALAETGMNYLAASTSEPSDSFPGLMALVTGGSPRTVGAFYDVAYDRSLDPPM